MKNYRLLTLLIPSLFIAACTQVPEASTEVEQTEIGVMEFPEGTVQHALHVEDMAFKPCPPHLPPGCEIVVLEGNPKVADMFTVRFHVDQGFVMPPHTHPKDERVTVIEGKVSVAFGADASHESATQFGPGDYYVNKRDEIHTVWADTSCILQITGIGPWEANFIDKETTEE